MKMKFALKIGLVAGIISAALPSIPTIVHFGYHREKWFWPYIGAVALILAALWTW